MGGGLGAYTSAVIYLWTFTESRCTQRDGEGGHRMPKKRKKGSVQLNTLSFGDEEQELQRFDGGEGEEK